MARRLFQMNREEAEKLAEIINDLTISRVGNANDYRFLAYLATSIEETFTPVRGNQPYRDNPIVF